MRALLTLIALSLPLSPACAERPPRPAAIGAGAPSAAEAPAATELSPFALALDGRADASGVTLTARVDVAWGLPALLEVVLTVPPGAALTQGSPRESIPNPRAGTSFVRRYRVVGAAGRPVAITASQGVPNEVGATATRSWPAATATDRAPNWQRVVPIRAGAVVIDQAVRLEPNPRR